MNNRLHTAALQLADRGLAVFPCQPRGKEPACDTGLHAATTDRERIDRWWQKIPDLNIGVATGAISRVFVLDVDGEDGEASLRKLEGEHSALPSTVEVITGKGTTLLLPIRQAQDRQQRRPAWCRARYPW
jgi:bifunctional DNA primase/polymerase-like protein